MNRIIRSRALSTLIPGPLLLGTWFVGCGLSGTVNDEVESREKEIQAELTRQMLKQVDLIVSNAPRQASTAPICEKVPGSECEICYEDTDLKQSLALKVPDCAIQAPPETREFSLKLFLKELSLAAVRQEVADPQIKIEGQGRLDLTAQILGTYTGSARYQILHGLLDTRAGTLDLALQLSYKSGNVAPLIINITVQGTRTNVSGSLKSPKMSCTVSGTLTASKIRCQ